MVPVSLHPASYSMLAAWPLNHSLPRRPSDLTFSSRPGCSTLPCYLRFCPTVVHSFRQHRTHIHFVSAALGRVAFVPRRFTLYPPAPRVKIAILVALPHPRCRSRHLHHCYQHRTPSAFLVDFDRAAHRRFLPRSPASSTAFWTDPQLHC
jgi:hypothetical protein